MYSSCRPAASKNSNWLAKNSQPPPQRRRAARTARISLLMRVELGLGEDDLAAARRPRGATPSSMRVEQLAQEARVEVQRLHHHVDAVAQRLDHLVGAAALRRRWR
ncbi:MAG: hypothetical protein V9E84_06475 [Trichococcus flocculiformis]